jgi:hypothetical protein
MAIDKAGRPDGPERLEILERRKKVASRYLAGERQWEIARSLEVHPAQICRDLKWIHKQWLKQATAKLAKRRAVELAKLADLERTYRRAWVESTEPREARRSRRTFGSPSKPNEEGEEDALKQTSRTEEVRTERRDGNVAFLVGIERCIRLRMEILGMIGSYRTDDTPGAEQRRQFTDEQRDEIRAQMYARLGLRPRTPAEEQNGNGQAGTDPRPASAGPG